MLRGLLIIVQFASRITSSALSRQRELEADVAAARYTRDPLSLAQALRMMGRHPGGAGYIPEGLAPLCIRTTEGPSAWFVGRWQATHPPLELRVGRLMALAHVSPDDFDRQFEAAGERFAEREHAVRPPASAAGRPDALAGLAGPALPPPRPPPRHARGHERGARHGGRRHDLPELRRRPAVRRLRGHPAAGLPCLRRPARHDRPGAAHRGAARGRLQRRAASSRRSDRRPGRPAAPRRLAAAQPGGGAPRALPQVRHDHDAPPLQLRARRRGRLLQPRATSTGSRRTSSRRCRSCSSVRPPERSCPAVARLRPGAGRSAEPDGSMKASGRHRSREGRMSGRAARQICRRLAIVCLGAHPALRPLRCGGVDLPRRRTGRGGAILAGLPSRLADRPPARARGGPPGRGRAALAASHGPRRAPSAPACRSSPRTGPSAQRPRRHAPGATRPSV